MLPNQNSSLITTTCGLCGGLGKAVLMHHPLSSITFQGTCEVFFYAVISALAGYGVKIGMDKLRKFHNRKHQ